MVTGAAVAVSGLVMLVGTLAFAAQPASRRWRPARHAPRARGGALRSPAIRTLVLMLFGTGVTFGATEIGVTAAAHALGSTTGAGPLLGLWGSALCLAGSRPLGLVVVPAARADSSCCSRSLRSPTVR